MFALIAVTETPLRINLKCDPELALHLRAAYPAVQPGYHMNKKHWNTVTIDGSVPEEDIISMIDDSYNLVSKKPGKLNDLKEMKGNKLRQIEGFRN